MFPFVFLSPLKAVGCRVELESESTTGHQSTERLAKQGCVLSCVFTLHFYCFFSNCVLLIRANYTSNLSAYTV